MRTLTKPPDVKHSNVPAEYHPLYKYLDGRYADTVVLTFADLEALLGFALPEAARLEPAWWSNDESSDAGSPQSGAWIHANRTARPNLPARIVFFDRVAD
jgi:hypothetical protein